MSYYTRLAPHRFQPTEHAGGAWNPDEVHFSPLGGLLLHEMDQLRNPGAFLSRVSFDILGFLGTGECEIHVETIRPGRTIQLIEATAIIGGRAAARARAWYLGGFDTTVAEGGAPPPLPAPDASPAAPMMTDRWSGSFVRSLDVRIVGEPHPGRATVWLSSEHRILDDEPIDSATAFISLVDTANGIAVRESPREWTFPNVDLGIHLYRKPVGRWVGLDTSVVFGPTGQGVTSTVLHDERGAVGVAQQSLTVRPAQR